MLSTSGAVLAKYLQASINPNIPSGVRLVAFWRPILVASSRFFARPSLASGWSWRPCHACFEILLLREKTTWPGLYMSIAILAPLPSMVTQRPYMR